MQIQIWINHWGYFQLRLCPLSSSSISAEKAQLSEGCLSRYVLPLKGGKGNNWIYKVQLMLLLHLLLLPAPTTFKLLVTAAAAAGAAQGPCLTCTVDAQGKQGNFVIDTAAKLPDGVACDRCVLQVCALCHVARSMLQGGLALSYTPRARGGALMVTASGWQLRGALAPKRTHVVPAQWRWITAHMCTLPGEAPLSWPGRCPDLDLGLPQELPGRQSKTPGEVPQLVSTSAMAA